MAFIVRNLTVQAYCNGFTRWHYYEKADGLACTEAAGFFDNAADMITAGDMIDVSASDGGATLYVIASGNTVVTVTMARTPDAGRAG